MQKNLPAILQMYFSQHQPTAHLYWTAYCLLTGPLSLSAKQIPW